MQDITEFKAPSIDPRIAMLVATKLDYPLAAERLGLDEIEMRYFVIEHAMELRDAVRIMAEIEFWRDFEESITTLDEVYKVKLVPTFMGMPTVVNPTQNNNFYGDTTPREKLGAEFDRIAGRTNSNGH